MGEDELLEIAVFGESVAALRGGDDESAGRDDLGGGGHALYRLVEILVERESAVGRDDDWERLRAGDYRGLLREGAALGMRSQHLAAEKARDLALAVLRDVD